MLTALSRCALLLVTLLGLFAPRSTASDRPLGHFRFWIDANGNGVTTQPILSASSDACNIRIDNLTYNYTVRIRVKNYALATVPAQIHTTLLEHSVFLVNGSSFDMPNQHTTTPVAPIPPLGEYLETNGYNVDWPGGWHVGDVTPWQQPDQVLSYEPTYNSFWTAEWPGSWSYHHWIRYFISGDIVEEACHDSLTDC